MSKANVLVVQRRLTHYRVPFFLALRSEMARRGLSLSLAVGTASSAERSKSDGAELEWAHRLDTRYLIGERVCWQPFGKLARNSDVVVCAHENKLVYNLVQQYAPQRRRLVLWGHGANLQGDAATLRERVKRLTARQADWWLGYTEMSRPLIERAFPASRITVLNNTIDTNSLVAALAGIELQEYPRVADSFGIRGGMVGVFIGSLYAEKRIAFLLEAAAQLKRLHSSFELLIGGAGPDVEMVEKFCGVNRWARYIGPVGLHTKARMLAVADVLLNPGLVGLGVMDSFTSGRPMVTTDCGLHSPEIAYLVDGFNGVMTKNDVSSFVAGAQSILVNDRKRALLQAGCRSSAKQYDLTEMVKRFCDGIEACLESEPFRWRA